MKPSAFILLRIAAASVVLASFAAAPPGDLEPVVVTPGTAGSPPSDAVVLFDGKDLSAWKSDDGSEPKWKVENGHMEVRGKSLMTRQEFGAIQLHLEWASPAEVKASTFKDATRSRCSTPIRTKPISTVRRPRSMVTMRLW
jgi:hypothetical protein